MPVTYDDSEYLWAHNQQPRGFGQWMFDLKYENGRSDRCTYKASKYGEAKRKALKVARQTGAWKVELCT